MLGAECWLQGGHSDSDTLWDLVQGTLGAPHPRGQAKLAAVRAQISVLNTHRSDMAAWAAARWRQRPAGSQEEAVAALLHEARAEILSLGDFWGRETWVENGPRSTSERPWEAEVAGQRVYIYIDASEGEGSGGGG